MHYYSFHPAKFNFETKHLSRLEKAIYRELIDDYMNDEKPFPCDIEKIQWRMGCETEQERNALDIVLDEFFVIKKDKHGIEYHHHPRLDKEIRAYRWNNRDKSGTEHGTVEERQTERIGTEQGTDRERKERYKKERSTMLNALSDIGVTLDKSIGMAELRKIYSDNFNENGTEHGTVEEQNRTQGNGTERPIFDVKQEPVISNKNQDKKQKLLASVTEVFEFWKSVFDKNDQTKLSDTRKRKIEQRLEDGYTVEQIKQAIFNCSKSDYHVTGNHIDLELICRSIEKMDYFLGLKKQQPKPQYGGANDPLAVNRHWRGDENAIVAPNTVFDFTQPVTANQPVGA